MFPSDRGNVAKPVRMALGSLIIQNRCGYTDRETVQQITENPYLQYFISLKEYQLTKPFTPVAMVKFRKRFNGKRLNKINEMKWIIAAETGQKKVQKESENDQDDQHHDDHNPPTGSIQEQSEAATAEESKAPEDEVEQTSETIIMLQFLVMNLEHKLKVLFAQILF